jgi:hypothetical protein
VGRKKGSAKIGDQNHSSAFLGDYTPVAPAAAAAARSAPAAPSSAPAPPAAAPAAPAPRCAWRSPNMCPALAVSCAILTDICWPTVLLCMLLCSSLLGFYLCNEPGVYSPHDNNGGWQLLLISCGYMTMVCLLSAAYSGQRPILALIGWVAGQMLDTLPNMQGGIS